MMLRAKNQWYRKQVTVCDMFVYAVALNKAPYYKIHMQHDNTYFQG